MPLYLTLTFAKLIGVKRYAEIAELPDTLLIGEWIFRDAAFGKDANREERFLRLLHEGDRFHQPVSSRSMAAVFDARRHVDSFLSQGAEQIEQLQPRIVGFSSTFQQHVPSLALAHEVKRRRPNTIVIFGGANCEDEMGAQTLEEFACVDVVVSGEADVVFPGLVDRLLSGREISDLAGVRTRSTPQVSRGGVVQDMDSLPIPSYDQFFDQLDRTALPDLEPRLPIEFSRGCWWGEKHHCTFCGLNGLTMSYRSKSPNRATDELCGLLARSPGTFVTVVDNIFNMKYFTEFLPRVAGLPGEKRFFAEIKANIRKPQLMMLREAGFLEIQPGIESLITPVLKLMRKGITGLQNIQLLKWAAEFGMTVHWNWIWGFPGEPPADYERWSQIVPWLSHLTPPSWSGIIHLQRFSPNFFDAEALGVRNLRPMPAYECVYPYSAESIRRLAYYFAFDAADAAEPGEYTRGLSDVISRWRTEYETSALFSIEEDDDLRVVDLRQVATSPFTIVRGLDRVVLDACDEVRALPGLAKQLGLSIHELAATIAGLESKRFVVRDGESVVSLVIKRPPAASKT